MTRIILSFALALVAFASEAKQFKTEFISMTLPENWDCVQEEIDWVCQPDNLAQRSEAIVIVVVKAANETDDKFENYQKILEAPRDMRDLLGNPYKAEVKYVRFKDILQHKWIDSLQAGSEIPGFFTRYAASIKGKISGLVTYSIAESVYPKWAPILDKMLDTIELRYDPKAFADAMKSNPTSLLGRRAGGLRGRFAPEDDDSPQQDKKGGFDITVVVGAILALGGVGYFIWKKRQQKQMGG
jgi:hypothetical protein